MHTAPVIPMHTVYRRNLLPGHPRAQKDRIGAISYFPITTMVIKEGVIPVDVDLLAIGFPKIGVLMFGCSSELEFGSGC